MKILVATDGSEYSTYAVNEFCRLFPQRADLRIKVVSAYEEAYAFASEQFSVPAEYYQQLVNTVKTQAGHFTATAAEIIRGGDSEMDLTIKIMNGPPEKEIVELAEEWGADLIVVGSHGRGRIGRMLGSVSTLSFITPVAQSWL
ncbi:MAG: universal stress protein [Pyrinomonadaceae bacterium]